MVVGPKVKANAKNNQPVYLQDIMATTLDLADVKKPDHVEFNSVLPLLAGGKSPYKSIYGGYLKKQRSVRTDQYKLIVYPAAKKLRLYDIVNDPKEMKDLADDPAMAKVKMDLFGELLMLQKQFNDKVDLSALAPN